MNSRIILGTVQFGLRYGINNQNGKPAIEQVFKMLELASERGVGILDTADAYGNATELLGEFNRLNPGAFKINTKFKVGQQSIEEQLAGSLLQLSADSINTYFFHSFDDFLNKPELLSDLVSLKEKGLIKKTGVSVYGNDEFELAINTQGVDVIQFPFNLLDNPFKGAGLWFLPKKKAKNFR